MNGTTDEKGEYGRAVSTVNTREPTGFAVAEPVEAFEPFWRPAKLLLLSMSTVYPERHGPIKHSSEEEDMRLAVEGFLYAAGWSWQTYGFALCAYVVLDLELSTLELRAVPSW